MVIKSVGDRVVIDIVIIVIVVTIIVGIMRMTLIVRSAQPIPRTANTDVGLNPEYLKRV